MGAAIWSIAAEICGKALPPVSLIILARILVPADFGVVATASVVVSFASMFWDAGLGQALIQRKGETGPAVNVVFWTNLVLAVGLYGLIVAFSGPLARFFGDERVQRVLCVQALVLIPSACSAVFSSLHRRQLDFRRLFWVRLATSLVPLISSVPLALAGWGYWALVAGSLAGAVLNLAVLWHGSGARIGFSYDTRVARELAGFGIFVMGESLLAWLYAWGDSLLIGRYLSLDELGLYRAANSVVTIAFATAVVPVFPVLFPLFARAANREELKRKLLEVVLAVSALSWALGVMFAFNGDFVVSLVLGEKWARAGELVVLLGILNGVSYYSLAGNEALRAAGQARTTFLMMLIALSYSLPVWFWSVQHGVETFLQARLWLLVPGHLVMFYFFRRALGISPAAWLANVTGNLGRVAVLVATGFLLLLAHPPLWLRFAVTAALTAAYLALVVPRVAPLRRVFEKIMGRFQANPG